MAMAACILFTLGLAVYIFFPDRHVAEQREKTRLEYLEEQKTNLYDNLRDLRFEHAAGKYAEGDYVAELSMLEAEAIEVVREIDRIGPDPRAAK